MYTQQIAALVATLVSGVPSIAQSAQQAGNQVDLRLRQAESQELALPLIGAEREIIPLRVMGLDTALLLERYSLYSPDFRLLVQTDSGIEEWPTPPVTTYRGTVAGHPDSFVTASVVDGKLEAMVRLSADREFWVQPDPQSSVSGMRPHLIYDKRDVLSGPEVCGADFVGANAPTSGPQRDAALGPEGPRGPQGSGAGQQEALGVDCYAVTDLAIDTDFEYFQLNGSNVTNTVNDITSVINGVEALYRDNMEITYQIGTIIVRSSSSDPYVSTGSGCGSPGLLQEFQSEWNTNQSAIKRDVAAHFTGKDLDGTIIGCAFGGVVCSATGAYGVNQARFTTNFSLRVALVAHELGHNWNAGHCDGDPLGCAIMCSGIGGCSGVTSVFAPTPDIAISNYRAAATCLSDIVYVSMVGMGANTHGTSALPYGSVSQGVTCSMSMWSQREVRVDAGTYDEGILTIDRFITLTPVGGPITIE